VKSTNSSNNRLKKSFQKLLYDAKYAENLVIKSLEKEESKKSYLDLWYKFSKKAEDVYPSQGLLFTPYDEFHQSFPLQMLSEDKLINTLRLRRYLLEVANHPYRIERIREINKQKFVSPSKVDSKTFENAFKTGDSLAIGDLSSSMKGEERVRLSRKQLYADCTLVKLGKQARQIFVGSASPDIWNSAAAVATMAASHCLTVVPRNGITWDLQRQIDLTKEVFDWLKIMADEILDGRKDKAYVYNLWKNNVGVALKTSPDDAVEAVKQFMKIGVKVFRPYSPEPSKNLLLTLKALRKEFRDEIEIIASYATSVEHAKILEKEGADILIIGTGGGGRCITAVRSGSAVDWPEIAMKLRGEIDIPLIAEGGASDNITTSLLLGITGIGLSRMGGGGSIESPGGALFAVDNNGILFKPYGGEASARAKMLDHKIRPFKIASFVEGKTTKAYIANGQEGALPTLTYNLNLLTEDVVLSLVYRGAESIIDLQNINPSPLKRISSMGIFQKGTH
jgi:hypothetical protein